MISTRLKVNTGPLLAIQRQARQTPALMGKTFQRNAGRVTRRFLDELTTEPRPAVHPFGFATPKSRRWYFYAVRAGLIPTDGKRYRRRGVISRAWKITVKPTVEGGEAVLENNQAAAQYVYGPRQVPGHAITGWPNVETLQEKYQKQFSAVAIESWYTVSDPFAGARG